VSVWRCMVRLDFSVCKEVFSCPLGIPLWLQSTPGSGSTAPSPAAEEARRRAEEDAAAAPPVAPPVPGAAAGAGVGSSRETTAPAPTIFVRVSGLRWGHGCVSGCTYRCWPWRARVVGLPLAMLCRRRPRLIPEGWRDFSYVCCVLRGASSLPFCEHHFRIALGGLVHAEEDLGECCHCTGRGTE
jgi:hypothetical protein